MDCPRKFRSLARNGAATSTATCCSDASGHLQVSHSYFDGEADSTREITFDVPTDSEDALAVVGRGLAWPPTGRGMSEYRMRVSRLKQLAMKHVPVASRARSNLSARRGTRSSLRVPAGTYSKSRFVRQSSRWYVVRRYYVEKRPPHRLIEMGGEQWRAAELLGSDPDEVLGDESSEGGEQALKRMGLSRRGLRMPHGAYLRSSRYTQFSSRALPPSAIANCRGRNLPAPHFMPFHSDAPANAPSFRMA